MSRLGIVVTKTDDTTDYFGADDYDMTENGAVVFRSGDSELTVYNANTWSELSIVKREVSE